MYKNLIFLLLISFAGFSQDYGIIDKNTTKKPRAGLIRLSSDSLKLYFRGFTGSAKEVVSVNNTYSNPSWLSSVALSKVTNLQDSLTNKVTKITGKGLSTNDFSNTHKSKVDGTLLSSINELQSYSGDKATFDGDTWIKKSGNVQNNGHGYNGTIIRASSSYYWERKTDFVTPEMFGAVGDSITDDSHAFYYALEAIDGKYKTLMLKEKRKYRTTYTGNYGSNLVIDGNFATIYFDVDEIGAVFSSKSFNSTYYAANGPTKNVVIKNLYIETNAGFGGGINISRAENVTLDNIVADGIEGHIADITGHQIVVQNCKAYNFASPNAPYQVDNLEVGLTGSQNIIDSLGNATSIVHDGYTSSNVKIINNYTYNCYHSVHLHRENLAGTKSSILVEGNTFINSEIPIYVDPGRTWDGVKIVNNFITSTTPRYRAILADGKLNRFDIIGNTFYNYANVLFQSSSLCEWNNSIFSNNQCRVENSSLSPTDRRALNLQRISKNLTVSNNIFDNFDRGFNSNSTATISRVVIENNKFFSMKDRAIGLDMAIDFVVKGNFIDTVNVAFDETTFTSTSWKTYGLNFGKAGIIINTSSQGIISENVINNVKGVAIALNSNVFSDITISNNRANNCVALLTTITNATHGNKLIVSGNTLKSNWNYTYGGVYIIAVDNVKISENRFEDVFYNNIDVRNIDTLSVQNNIIEGRNVGVDRKGIVFVTCSVVSVKGNTMLKYGTITSNYDYFIDGVTNGEMYISRYLGWANAANTSSCRIFYSSNNFPTNTQVGKYAVGSIITNDNYTGGTPTGEPMGWVCTAESTTSTFVPHGQIGYRTTTGSPNSNTITPIQIGEFIFDSTNNRWFRSISTSAPTSTVPSWVLTQNEYISYSATVDPPSVASLGVDVVDYTVTGATTGMFTDIQFQGDTGSMIIFAKVKLADTVRVVLFNPTGSPINIASMTMTIRVKK